MRTEWSEAEIRDGKHPFKWSLITDTDRATIRLAVKKACDLLIGPYLKFLEIGTYNGSTAWGVKTVTEEIGRKLHYWGVDIMTHNAVLWPEANFVLGDSTKIFYEIPNVPFDILFIDGPHSTDHCMLDFLNFAPKVKSGGLILFHDTSPSAQCKLPFSPEKEAEYRDRGWEIPIYEEFGTAVLIALDKLGLSSSARTDFELVSNNWTDEPYGGISIYRRLR